MNSIRGFALVFASVLIFTAVLTAQKPAPAPPQTPRQALVEMINGGGKSVMKHLTVEVQQLLSKPENQQAAIAMGMFESLKSQAGSDVQVFETGPVLLSVNDAKQHQKLDVNVNNDDMSGDQDAMELSVHMFRDGQEQQEDWGMFLSHITVTMNRQQNIWRLSKVALGVEFPLGDAEFLKKTFLKSPGVGMVGMKIGPPVNHSEVKAVETVEPAEPVNTAELSPVQLAMVLGLAEETFARQHADVGFSCSLSDLGEAGKNFGLDPQTSTGFYKGYKLNLTGCQGKPAGSFQITLEPLSPGSGGKAYCIDATQNIRAADDGRAATCLAVGQPVSAAGEDQSGSIGWDPVSAGSTVKPRN